jgi:hypothetical protein
MHSLFDPAIPAIIPQIVKRDQLIRANSQTQFVSGISAIVGPTLGGLTVAWAGYSVSSHPSVTFRFP